MVKMTAFILSVTSALFLAAGEFTASVSSNEVDLNDSFSLSLTLKDTSPKDSPALFPLKKDFLIQSEQHSSNTTIINGKISSSITWKVSLTPKLEGVVEIPPITVNTTEGQLSTQPISLNIIKGAPAQSIEDTVGLNFASKVNNASPYKNEPFIFTAFLSSKWPIYQVQPQKLQVEDAIVELIEEPKLEERVIGGVWFHVVEISYLITPLKTGPLTIPSLAIQGAIPQKRKGRFSSRFNDDLDPFAIMQGFDRLKPFALKTEEIELDVQPPISVISPWLPAKALILEEKWPSDQTLRVGEPFSRGFLIQAEGLKLSQLPRLEEQSSKFKVYADKPEEEEKVIQGTIHSMRKEQYTLIPEQAGTWVLPEISIAWWDTVKKEKKVSTIPARRVEILPALEAATSLPQENPSIPPSALTTDAPVSLPHPPFFLYGIIGILTFFLAAALLWGFILQRKIASLTAQKLIKPLAAKPKKTISPPVIAAPIPKEKKEKLPDLNPT